MHCFGRGRTFHEDAADDAGHGADAVSRHEAALEINPDHEIVKKLEAATTDRAGE